MKLDSYGSNAIAITLSERNLRSLLSKVQRDDSARTMVKPDDAGGPTLIVSAEPDVEHYGSRGYGPGEVHPVDDPGVATPQSVAASLYIGGCR